MTSSKSTKRALVSSTLAILMCVAMLIGTTFAWFTDSVTNTGNKIQAGTLDVALLNNGVDISDSNTPVFNYELWEPGYSTGANLAVKNNGSLALKYELVLQNVVTTKGIENVIDVIVGGSTVGTLADFMNGEILASGNLTASATSNTYAIVLKMQETAGNDYQDAEATFDMLLRATQYTYEEDGFGSDQYDKDAGTDEFKQGVTISGIAGVAESYDTIQDAYEDVKAMLVANSGLGEQQLNEEAFNAFFTDGGKITWTIYGNQKVTDTRMFSFGRAANRFGEGRHITEINIVGGNSSAALDLTAVNGTFALPYNWWNVEDSVNTALKCKNITFNGIKYMPSATYQCTLYSTTYEFDDCTFNGNLYSYQNFDVNMTIKNCTFNAPADTQYAFMSQGQGGTITLDNNIFNNYTRGINLQRPKADFVVTNNTIRSTVSEPDRGAIQLTDGNSFVVTGNKVDVNAGNAFWFHDAATNADVTYTISNNDIKAPYIGYSGVTAFNVNDKITSSGNNFNSTDTTKCMKKDATVAEATNLTAIH